MDVKWEERCWRGETLGQEYVRGMPSDLVWREVSLLGRGALGSEWVTP